MPNVFMTGGTGFLGSHVLDVLRDAGWTVYLLRRPTSDVSHVEGWDNIIFVDGDILDYDSLMRGMPDAIDAVFHIAGSAGNLPHHKEYIRYAINHTGTKNVVDVALKKKAKRFIHTSTIAVYDWHTQQPMTEHTPPNLWSKDHYVRSKYMADVEVEEGIKKGLDAVFLHPCALMGRYDKETWSKAFREIDRGIPFPFAPPGSVNVSPAPAVARAFLTAYENAPTGAHYIVGGPAVTFLELFQEVARLIDRPGPKWALPVPIFKALGYLEFAFSALIGREPTFTPHTLSLMCYKILGGADRAVYELGYAPSSLQEALIDCRDWMIETGRLQKSKKV
jgi:dihydroflavonol-4-reductase